MSPRIDLRHAVSALVDAGETPTAIVKTLHFARSFVYKVKNLREAGGDLFQKVYYQESSIMTPQVQKKVVKRIKADAKKSISAIADDVGVAR